MNNIKKIPIDQLGYNFIPAEYIPEGKDEYYLRFQQNPDKDYRELTKAEIAVLEANGNVSTNWKHILIKDTTDISLIKLCRFFGLVRIGKLEPFVLEFSEFRIAVGLYKSHIISCDIGDNVAISNVRYLSHYILGEEVILTNINEMSCTSHSKFGNGVVKEGESESVRIWLELSNENGGRKVLPFDGMLAADAWLWSKYRDDKVLMNAFQAFTEKAHNQVRGYYGTIGKRTVIKNTLTIKDVKIGEDAYIKGANKLKNLTINSSAKGKSQIGEGCEIVNGIMGEGSRSFYGVKAVRFVQAPFAQLKYGARLINSYLGENATISCCEVLNSLIFPAHEQHHNNSFLCAAVIMGQSNMAAGATIGSNHNSRGADGEIQAGRGFWPGLCVSLKHNSKFASFTMLAKGDYPAELNIPFPFSLSSIHQKNDELLIMPAYWMLYNMYAILRNERKFSSRDRRIVKLQAYEYDFLAPDTINEVFSSLRLLELFTGKAFFIKNEKIGSDAEYIAKGKSLLEHQSPLIKSLDVFATGIENSKRNVRILKVQQAYDCYKMMVAFYAGNLLAQYLKDHELTELNALLAQNISREEWTNLGGQLVPKKRLQDLFDSIYTGNISSWEDMHQFYEQESENYTYNKLLHAIASICELKKSNTITPVQLQEILLESITVKEWMVKNIYSSKAKDFSNHFRNMMYDNTAERDAVVGALADNSFIQEQQEELAAYKQLVVMLLKKNV